MNFSKYQRTISLTLLILLGIGSTLPAVGSGGISGNKLTKLGQNQDVLLAQTRRKRKSVKFNLSFPAPTDRKARFGAMRGGVCQDNQSAAQKDIIALLPPDSQPVTLQKADKNSITDKIQLTTAAHPTVLFYLPENSPTTASFYLYKNNTLVYSALDFPLPNKTSNNSGGLVILNLANAAKQNFPELKVGENYIWQVKLSCTSNTASETPKISGWVRRIDAKVPLGQQLDASIISRNKLTSTVVIADELKKVEPIEYPRIYAENGIWYSAINSLVELIAAKPQDPEIKKDWEELLSSGNLTEIAGKPIIGSATISNVEVNKKIK